MKAYKLFIVSKQREDVSEKVQKHAFKLGYHWKMGGDTVQYMDMPFLFFDASGGMRYAPLSHEGVFIEDNNELISVEEFLRSEVEKKEKKLFVKGGVVFDVSDRKIYSSIYRKDSNYVAPDHTILHCPKWLDWKVWAWTTAMYFPDCKWVTAERHASVRSLYRICFWKDRPTFSIDQSVEGEWDGSIAGNFIAAVNNMEVKVDCTSSNAIIQVERI